jgi:protein-disulfide isomerase
MSSVPKESKRTTKEKAAAARAAAEAEHRRRDRRNRLILGGALVVVVGLIIGIAVRSSASSSPPSSGVAADASVPKGVNGSTGSNPWGVPVNSVANKPTLAIWEDFQCPICGNFEKTYGAAVRKLATDGKVNLVWRPTTFLDTGAAETTGPNPLSSHRAAMAWGCAIDAGKSEEYHTIVFANQPANEGDGWTDQQLLDFGATAGITGDAATTFTSCVKAKTYDQWVTNSYDTFTSDAIVGTPAAYLNGTEVPTATLTNMAALEKLIASTPAS